MSQDNSMPGGGGGDAPATPVTAQEPQPNGQGHVIKMSVEQVITQFVHPAVCTCINGILLSLRQMPIEVVLVTTCGMFGRFISEASAVGNLGPILTLRKNCLEAFEKGVRSITPKPAPLQPGAPPPPKLNG